MSDPLDRMVRDIESYNALLEPDGQRSIAGIPYGRRLEMLRSPLCRWWRHKWTIESYLGVKYAYRDKVCTVCGRRKELS